MYFRKIVGTGGDGVRRVEEEDNKEVATENTVTPVKQWRNSKDSSSSSSSSSSGHHRWILINNNKENLIAANGKTCN